MKPCWWLWKSRARKEITKNFQKYSILLKILKCFISKFSILLYLKVIHFVHFDLTRFGQPICKSWCTKTDKQASPRPRFQSHSITETRSKALKAMSNTMKLSSPVKWVHHSKTLHNLGQKWHLGLLFIFFRLWLAERTSTWSMVPTYRTTGCKTFLVHLPKPIRADSLGFLLYFWCTFKSINWGKEMK